MATLVSSFEEIQEEFERRWRRIVWCNVATVDFHDRPRSRMLHPIWEGPIGWILTGRHSAKEKHLAHNPHVSVCYWDPEQQQIYAECTAAWVDAQAEKTRIWDLFKETPQPIGYDPAIFWPAGPTDPGFGVLRLTPWRVEICGLQELMTNSARVWAPRQG